MPTRVAVLDDYQQVALASADWASLGPDVEVVAFHDHLTDPGALADRLTDFDVVVAMRERTALGADVLASLPRLRLLVTTGMGNAVIDMEAAAANGITVCGTGGTIHGTAELTWGLILAVLRHIPAEDAAVRAGHWQHTMGTELRGRTLGLLGLGRIGKQVARVGRAFGMDVIAWSQNLTPERAEACAAELVTRAELFERADVLSVHLVLSERSRGLVGADELSTMKPTAVVVNTSRGPIVDEGALVAALRRGAIAGAGLDVFAVEPLPHDHPLRTLPNTVVTPHLGYVTSDLYALFHTEVVEDIAGWLAGEPVRVVVAP